MKPIFPEEFADILNQKGLDILAGKKNIIPDDNDKRLKVVQDIIKPKHALRLLTGLEENIFPLLRNQYSPISPSIKELKKGYTEHLGKSMKIKSDELNSTSSLIYKIAQETGLISMLSSPSYKAIGEMLLRKKFGNPITKQIVCYQHGDYVSPHNDHLPENENIRKGYYDVHLMLSNKHVKHQWLVYEQKRFLNKFVDIASLSGVAVYRLPFWHYTTPMIAKQGEHDLAKRWLFLHSFELS